VRPARHPARCFLQRFLRFRRLALVVSSPVIIGAWPLVTFHCIVYVFGAFLVVTGFKMWFAADKEPSIEDNPVLRLLKRNLRITIRFDGERLSTAIDGVRH